MLRKNRGFARAERSSEQVGATDLSRLSLNGGSFGDPRLTTKHSVEADLADLMFQRFNLSRSEANFLRNSVLVSVLYLTERPELTTQ